MVSSKILPLISSKTDIGTTFSGRGLICLTPEQLKNVLITFLILLIFSEKKEANSLHLLRILEHFTWNLAWGGCQSLYSSKKSECVV